MEMLCYSFVVVFLERIKFCVFCLQGILFLKRREVIQPFTLQVNYTVCIINEHKRENYRDVCQGFCKT